MAATPIKVKVKMPVPIEEFGELIAIFVALLALVVGAYNFFHSIRSYGRKRRKLVNAIYYHAKMAVASLEIQKDNNDSYTPYAPYSPADDVTYEQIIELMGYLPKRKCPFNRKKEKAMRRKMEQDISSYFHWQARFHAIAQSFHSESIGKWAPERKLQLWMLCEESLEEALEFAKKTRDVLEPYVD